MQHVLRRRETGATIILMALIMTAFAGAGTAVAAPSVETVVVSARSTSWVPTGIELEEGDEFTVTARGAVNTWLGTSPFSVSGPEGQPFPCLASNVNPPAACPVEGAPYGALVGRIGGSTFVIGDGGTFVAPESGELELLVNDNLGFAFDNAGSYAVQVSAA